MVQFDGGLTFGFTRPITRRAGGQRYAMAKGKRKAGKLSCFYPALVKNLRMALGRHFQKLLWAYCFQILLEPEDMFEMASKFPAINRPKNFKSPIKRTTLYPKEHLSDAPELTLATVFFKHQINTL